MIKLCANSLSGEDLLRGSQIGVFGLYSRVAHGMRALSRVSLAWALILFTGLHVHDLITSKHRHIREQASTCEFWGDTVRSCPVAETIGPSA